MYLDGDTIVVTSTPHFFAKEISGEKPYTVRIVTETESERILYRKPERIRICEGGSGSDLCFERTITSLDKLGELLGFGLVGIAWDPAEGRK